MNTPAPTARPRPKRMVFKGLFALGVILAAAWLFFFALWLRTSGTPLAPPPLPSPNGYDDVMRAGKEMEKLTPVVNGKLPDADSLETPALREYVEKNKEALTGVRKGLDLPFQIPFSYASIEAMNHTVNESGILRTRVARVLYAEGVLSRRDGRVADALRSFTDLLKLGDGMGRKVPMGLSQASLAPQALGLVGIRDLREALDADQLRAAINALYEFDAGREPIGEVIRREHAFIDQNLKNLGMLATAALTVSGNVKASKAQVATLLEDSTRWNQTRFRLLAADLALRLYFKENGRYPASLSEVNATLPPDPYSPTQSPLIYRRTETGYQLYSVGPDGDDDRLDPTLKKQFQRTSNGDFSLDSF